MTVRHTDRRIFIRVSGAAAASVLGGSSFLSRLPPVSADEAVLSPDVSRFPASVDPLVRLIEDSPRSMLLERVAARIHDGASYRDILAALLLAGVRNVQPRPSVGFKFHCVLVVNSCHLAALAGPDEDRWLPIFWALDYFKSSQADEAQKSGWRMQPVNESLVPDAERSARMFTEAMDQWDVQKADAATAGLVRHAGATEVFNLFARYAARDYRSIGHKAIYLANAWRTLQVIGQEFAEPVLRSLTFALLNHEGESNPATSDHAADRPWKQNAELQARMSATRFTGRVDDDLPPRLFETFRNGSPAEAAQTAAEALDNGAGPQSVWDGVFCGAAELLMRQPGIIGLHGLTTANAMHYLWANAADDGLRCRLLLQACSFNPMFRDSAVGRGSLADRSIDELHPSGEPQVSNAVPEILRAISDDRMQAARLVCGYLADKGDPYLLMDAARQTLFMKGRDAHDYKFSSAVLEDFGHVSSTWRDRFLAMSVFNLKGSGHPDNSLVTRTRAALDG